MAEPFFKFPRSDNVENVENYIKGGYHPVLIGDLLDDKYMIIHKLGFGGFSTVWLARDPDKKLVAIKIGIATESVTNITDPKTEASLDLEVMKRIDSCPGFVKKFINLPTEEFSITGPNGVHICTVSDVYGPSIAHITRMGKKLSPKDGRRAALQATQVLAWMHSKDVDLCHGDFTSSNILLEVFGLNGKQTWSDKDIYAQLGEPVTEDVRPSESGSPLPESAPKYLVEPADLTMLLPNITGNIRIIDFGEFYSPSKGNPTARGTPFTFCPPEALYKDHFHCGSDVWALGCTIFEIRSGVPLLERGFGSKSEIFRQYFDLLGLLPGEYNYGGKARNDGESLMARLKEIKDEAVISEIPGDFEDKKRQQSNDYQEEDENFSHSASKKDEAAATTGWLVKDFKLDRALEARNKVGDEESPDHSDLKKDAEDQTTAAAHKSREDAEARPIDLEKDATDAPMGAAAEIPSEESESEYEYSDDGSANLGFADSPVGIEYSQPVSSVEIECLHDLLTGVFDYDQTKRLTASEMLTHPWFSMKFDS